MKQVRPLSSANQGPYFRKWEFRQDRINLRGSTVTEDLRIRHTASLAPIAPATAENPWSNVTIQILASVNALAKLVAYNYALARNAPAADKMAADAARYTSSSPMLIRGRISARTTAGRNSASGISAA